MEFLMTQKKARAICGAITCIMHMSAYAASAEMASELGPFPEAMKEIKMECCVF